MAKQLLNNAAFFCASIPEVIRRYSRSIGGRHPHWGRVLGKVKLLALRSACSRTREWLNFWR